MKLYQKIASVISAISNCEKSGNREWLLQHKETLAELLRILPSGSGIDMGTKLDLDSSSPKKLVLLVDFHHMDENGYYDSWVEYKVIVKPSLQFDFTLKVTGKDKNCIKEYLYELYNHALQVEYSEVF